MSLKVLCLESPSQSRGKRSHWILGEKWGYLWKLLSSTGSNVNVWQMVVIMVNPPTIPALKMRDWREKEGHPPVRRPRIQVHLSCARSFCPSTLSDVSRQIMVGTTLEIWCGTYKLRIYFFPERGVRCFRKAENIHTKVQS